MNDTIQLDIDSVEMILESCIDRASLESMIYFTGVPYTFLKVQLFYLVEYNIVSYVGQERVFFLTQQGWKLLSAIDETKYLVNLNEDEYIATITLE